MTSIEEIEQIIKPFLLTQVNFTVDDKTVKQGTLQLFCIKDFFCVFTLLSIEKSNKKTIYELPYPFHITASDKNLEFDYTLDSFCLSSAGIREQVNKVKLSKTSKFFNKKVIVSYV